MRSDVAGPAGPDGAQVGQSDMSEEIAGVSVALHKWIEDSEIDASKRQRRAAHVSAQACLDAGATFETAVTAGALVVRLLVGDRDAIRL